MRNSRLILPCRARRGVAAMLAGLAAGLFGALPARAEPGLLCRAAIEAAERSFGLPPRLLAAIGRVESGRRDPLTGTIHPWPWTINAEGRGSFFPSREAAIAEVRALQARGVRSIDVGCMQVNLRHHPNAFASLEDAFEPMANAAYAARFLTELQQARGGDWQRAAAAYHSANPEFGEPYRARVLAALEEEGRRPASTPLPGAGGGVQLARAPTPPPPPGGIGGGAFLSNAADRAPLLAAAGTGTGRGLDAYRTAPIPLVGRSPPALALAAAAPAAGRAPPAAPLPGGPTAEAGARGAAPAPPEPWSWPIRPADLARLGAPMPAAAPASAAPLPAAPAPAQLAALAPARGLLQMPPLPPAAPSPSGGVSDSGGIVGRRLF